MKIKIIFSFFIILSIISCGNEPPNLSFPTYNILIYQSGAFSVPNDSIYLSMYFVINDDDGFEDITKIKITHVKSENAWDFGRDKLSTYQWENKNFYGIPFLEYNGGKSILLGDYKIEVEDSSGNLSELFVNVEIEGNNSDIAFNVPEIKYKIEVDKKNKELKIKNDTYSSAEIKIMNRQDLYNFGRKKFRDDEKIKLTDSEINNSNLQLSFKINKDVNENIVYFLKQVDF